MFRVKFLDDTEGTRFALSALTFLGWNSGTSVMVLGEFIPNGFYSYIHGRQSDIKKHGIFQVLIEKFEHSRTADVISV